MSMDNPEGSVETGLDDVSRINATTDGIMATLAAEAEAEETSTEEVSKEEVSEETADEETTDEEVAESTDTNEEVDEAEVTQENDDAESDGDSDEEPTYTVTVNGEELEVTFDELKDGYSRQSDYTRKTGELAEQRKQFEASIEAVKQSHKQGLEQALYYANNFDPVLQEANNTDWSALAQSDPTEYTRKKAAVEQRVAYIQQMTAQQSNMTEATNKELLNKEVQMLSEKIPEWKDEKVRSADLELIVSGLREYGFSDKELNAMVDHRAFMMARDAVRYRKLMKAKKTVGNKKVKSKAPKMQKPGTQTETKKRNPNANKALLAKAKESNRTGSIVDAIMKNI